MQFFIAKFSPAISAGRQAFYFWVAARATPTLQVYFTKGFATMRGLICTCLSYLALIDAEILFNVTLSVVEGQLKRLQQKAGANFNHSKTFALQKKRL